MQRSVIEGALGHVSSGATSVKNGGYADDVSYSDNCKKCLGGLDSKLS